MKALNSFRKRFAAAAVMTTCILGAGTWLASGQRETHREALMEAAQTTMTANQQLFNTKAISAEEYRLRQAHFDACSAQNDVYKHVLAHDSYRVGYEGTVFPQALHSGGAHALNHPEPFPRKDVGLNGSAGPVILKKMYQARASTLILAACGLSASSLPLRDETACLHLPGAAAVPAGTGLRIRAMPAQRRRNAVPSQP